jgi:hypothetical protein
MDAGVTTHCAAVSCGQAQTAIPLGGQTFSVDSFRTGGLHFYDTHGIRIQDRETVFDRVRRAQIDLEGFPVDNIGGPIVKTIQYVCAC